MYQAWRNLTFLHWRYPPAVMQQYLPAGLRVDSNGTAKWLDAPDLSVRNLPRSLVVAYVSTDARTFPEAMDTPSPAEIKTLLGVAAQVGASFLGRRDRCLRPQLINIWPMLGARPQRGALSRSGGGARRHRGSRRA